MENKTEVNAVFPTSYFPPISLMAAMCRHAISDKKIWIEKHETFPKQTYRNRTMIVTANGIMPLSVPLERPNGTHTKTSDIGVCYTERWSINHLRAIDSAYNASPYYMYYKDNVSKIILGHFDRLTELNMSIAKMLFKALKIDADICFTEDYFDSSHYNHDYRNAYSYKHPEELPKTNEYTQVFRDRMPFCNNVGILDLIFNLRPETKAYLLKIES